MLYPILLYSALFLVAGVLYFGPKIWSEARALWFGWKSPIKPGGIIRISGEDCVVKKVRSYTTLEIE